MQLTIPTKGADSVAFGSFQTIFRMLGLAVVCVIMSLHKELLACIIHNFYRDGAKTLKMNNCV